MFHRCPIDRTTVKQLSESSTLSNISPSSSCVFACQSQCCPKIARGGRCQRHILPPSPPLHRPTVKNRPRTSEQGPKSGQLLPGFKGPSPPPHHSAHCMTPEFRPREKRGEPTVEFKEAERIPRGGQAATVTCQPTSSGTCLRADRIPFLHEPKCWKWKSGREFGNQTELYLIGTALQEEKSSRQKFVSGETTVGKSWMGLVGLLGRVGGPFKPPERDDGCDLATVAPLPLDVATGGFKVPHRCPLSLSLS